MDSDKHFFSCNLRDELFTGSAPSSPYGVRIGGGSYQWRRPPYGARIGARGGWYRGSYRRSISRHRRRPHVAAAARIVDVGARIGEGEAEGRMPRRFGRSVITKGSLLPHCSL